MSKKALETAIEKVGTIEAFAEMVGVTPRQVYNWKNGDGLPVGRVPDVSYALKIPMHKLRPDKFRRTALK